MCGKGKHNQNFLVFPIILILLYPHILCAEKEFTIKLNLIKENGFLFAPIELGQPAQNLNLLVDILSNATYVAGSKCTWYYGYIAQNTAMFLEDKSTSLVSSNVSIEARKESSRFQSQGFLTNDSLKLNNATVQDFSFVLANHFISDVAANGVIGLDKGGKIDKDDNTTDLTLTSSLLRRNLIKSNVFAINLTEQSLTLGGYPNISEKSLNLSTCSNENLTYENSFTINANDRVNSHWMCKVSRVFTGDISLLNSIVFDKIALFSSTISGVLLSSDYLTFFKRNYFYGFSINNCLKLEKGYTYIYACQKRFNISLLPTLNIEIDNWVYVFKPESLFVDILPTDYYFETASAGKLESDKETTYNYFKIRFVNKH